MIRHNLLHHQEEDPLNRDYLWTVVSQHSKPLERAVEEAIRIKMAFQTEEKSNNYICMNCKREYSRNILPGISRKTNQQDKDKEEKMTLRIMEAKKLYQVTHTSGGTETLLDGPAGSPNDGERRPEGTALVETLDEHTGGPSTLLHLSMPRPIEGHRCPALIHRLVMIWKVPLTI